MKGNILEVCIALFVLSLVYFAVAFTVATFEAVDKVEQAEREKQLEYVMSAERLKQKELRDERQLRDSKLIEEYGSLALGMIETLNTKIITKKMLSEDTTEDEEELKYWIIRNKILTGLDQLIEDSNSNN